MTPFAAAKTEAIIARQISQDKVLFCVCSPLSTLRFLGFARVANSPHRVSWRDFRAAGAEVHLASDDGSLGFHGFVTQLLDTHTLPQHLIGCGPEPMMRALAKLAERRNVPCHLSLESPMACGVGICLSCVTKVRTGAEWDYRRVCVEGPVFDAACLAWDE